MPKPQKIALVTGAAKRIGAETARVLHAAGFGVVLHYNQSADAARKLQEELNGLRESSAWVVQAELRKHSSCSAIIESVLRETGRLDVLVNNASSFYATPIATVSEEQWDDLVGSNLKAAFFLAQAAQPALKQSAGCIINMVDIYAQKPKQDFPVYSIAKAGLLAMTKSLAKEMSPEIRVNGVSPGVILWPEEVGTDIQAQEAVLSKIPLKRKGEPSDIAKTVLFLANDAPYITGQVISVDGGKGLL